VKIGSGVYDGLVNSVWARGIRRADVLAESGGPAASLLAFYADLLRSQQAICAALSDRPDPLSGTLARDVDLLADPARGLIERVVATGPEPLAAEAQRSLDAEWSGTRTRLLTSWQSPSDREFFAKAILQPYARCLADAGVPPADRAWPRGDARCPFCGGAPQLSILESPSGPPAEGGGRRLLCATCLTEWPFRRVRCAHCGEEDEHKLSYFHGDDLVHLRVDTCESCRRYVKTVDLTRVGLAVPLVDEVAGAALDVWARDRGYDKIELNLLGL
jgi:FdhE protein